MKYLVDANVLSEATRPNPHPGVIDWLRRHELEIAVDPIVLGEIRFGILLLRGAEPTAQRRGRTIQTNGMPNRAADWLAQAERDLEHASASREQGRHEWACFAAQQAAEKALKAVHLARGQDVWGHVLVQLLAELPTPAPSELVERARVLDNFYIPTRYPNGHPAGAPFEHYGPLQSEQALSYAREILAFARSQMA